MSGSLDSGSVAADDEQAMSLLHVWTAVLVLAVAGYALGSDLYVLPALLPAISGELRVANSATAQVISIYGLLAALGAPLLAVVFRSMERRTLLAGSLVVLIAANLLTLATPNLGWLAGTRVLAAVAAALLAPIRTAAAGQVAPVHLRAKAIGVATAGQSAALVLAAPVALLAASAFGWRAAFAVSAAVSFVALAGTLLLMPRLPAVGASRLREQLAVLRQSPVLLMLLSNAAALCAIFIPLTFLRLVVGRATLLDAIGVSAVFALYGVAGTAGNAAAGWLAGRFGAFRVMVGGLVVAALAVAALSPLTAASASRGTTAAVVLLVVLWGLGAWSYYALQFHRLMQLAPSAPTLALSWASPASYVGLSVGASLGGLLLQYGSITAIGWAGGVFFLLSALLVVAATSRQTVLAPGS